MPDKIARRSSELQGKELSAETTVALKQPAVGAPAAQSEPEADGFIRSAGSWKDLVDPEALIEVIYASRLVKNAHLP